MVVLDRPPAIPDAPGSYQFKDDEGRVIYVGKASSLRSRLGSYFQDRATLHPRTAQMLDRASSVEWIQVASDVEALLLEYNLIKEHRPRFNIRLVDDKSYPYLAVTVADRWPRALVLRGAKRKGARYFGPYVHAYAIRETLDSLLRSFPVRTCSDAKLVRHERLGRPCLLYHIERCSGPCVQAVEPDVYRGYVEELMDFLEGETKPVTARLEREMTEAAGALEFERAARLRDQLSAVRLAVESQQMVTDRPEDFDVVGVADDELEAAVQVLRVRRGRVVGRHGFVLEKVEELSAPALVARILEQHYAETPLPVPPEVLVPDLPEDTEVLSAFLARRRDGRRVTIHVPVRGRKRGLLATARTNASEQLARHRLHRASDLTSRARALEELQQALGLAEAPLRIECYDMSHFQGTDYVGSMVVMEDGLPKRSDYRRFKVSAVQGNDDYGAMHEVLTRRLRHLLESPSPAAVGPESSGSPDSAREPGAAVSPASAAARGGASAPRPAGEPDAEGPGSLEGRGLSPEDRDRAGGTASPESGDRRRGPVRRFAYRPNLLLLDGGKGQLHVGTAVLAELGLSGTVGIASLAKQFEEVFVPGRDDPIRIARDSAAIYLLQQVRDEAHRYAITFHRELRGKRMTRGALEGIPGLGESRRSRLIRELGGVQGVRDATREQLAGLPWLPRGVGEAVFAHLHGLGGDRPERRSDRVGTRGTAGGGR